MCHACSHNYSTQNGFDLGKNIVAAVGVIDFPKTMISEKERALYKMDRKKRLFKQYAVLELRI